MAQAAPTKISPAVLNRLQGQPAEGFLPVHVVLRLTDLSPRNQAGLSLQQALDDVDLVLGTSGGRRLSPQITSAGTVHLEATRPTIEALAQRPWVAAILDSGGRPARSSRPC